MINIIKLLGKFKCKARFTDTFLKGAGRMTEQACSCRFTSIHDHDSQIQVRSKPEVTSVSPLGELWAAILCLPGTVQKAALEAEVPRLDPGTLGRDADMSISASCRTTTPASRLQLAQDSGSPCGVGDAAASEAESDGSSHNRQCSNVGVHPLNQVPSHHAHGSTVYNSQNVPDILGPARD